VLNVTKFQTSQAYKQKFCLDFSGVMKTSTVPLHSNSYILYQKDGHYSGQAQGLCRKNVVRE